MLGDREVSRRTCALWAKRFLGVTAGISVQTPVCPRGCDFREVDMAHLWLHEASEGEAAKVAPDDWSPMLLDEDSLAIACSQLLRSTAAEGGSWVLVGPPAVHVNGSPLHTGIRVLRDRDELRADRDRIFFTTESLAAVVPFPGSGKKTFCVRCKLEILPGSPAVACPQCKLFHHQSVERDCWTYNACCAVCPQETPFDTGFRWLPEEL
jgi:hypothetical protein